MTDREMLEVAQLLAGSEIRIPPHFNPPELGRDSPVPPELVALEG
jgi:hypothetical protein